MSEALYPLFFTLEKVTNGYILTSRKEPQSHFDEAGFTKEIVTEDKINSRIGQLLHLDKMLPEKPRVFYVEAVREGVYKSDDKTKSEPDASMDARLAFAHFNSDPKGESGYVALQITDTGTLEIYGDQAMTISENNNIPITRKGNIPYLRFQDNKDGKKMLAAYCENHLRLLTVTSTQISKWYEEHGLKKGVDS